MRDAKPYAHLITGDCQLANIKMAVNVNPRWSTMIACGVKAVFIMLCLCMQCTRSQMMETERILFESLHDSRPMLGA